LCGLSHRYAQTAKPNYLIILLANESSGIWSIFSGGNDSLIGKELAVAIKRRVMVMPRMASCQVASQERERRGGEEGIRSKGRKRERKREGERERREERT
jgi:hypothetical protein